MAVNGGMRSNQNAYGDFIRREGKLNGKPAAPKTGAPADRMRKQFDSDAARKVISDTQGGLSMNLKGYGH